MPSTNLKTIRSNRTRGVQFRQLIAAALRAEGVGTVEAKALTWSLAQSFDESEQSDLQGLPGSWLVNVRYGHGHALAETLDEAEGDARTDRKDKAAIVIRRVGYGPESAFVVMSLSTFALVLKDAPQ